MPWVRDRDMFESQPLGNRHALFLIRRATPVDANTIIAGINSVCAEGEVFYTTQFISTAQWEAALYHPETAPDHLLAIAEWEGQFAVSVQIFPGVENTLFRHVGEMGIFVMKPYRGRGIGRELLAWLLRWSKKAGLEKVTLSVFATNLAAIALYRKFGFIEEGRRGRQFKISDRYVDEILMALFLDSYVM